MCYKFLRAAVGVLTNETIMLDSNVYGDSHGLNGALQAVAECDKWFPELVLTTNTWTISVEAAPYM